MFGTIVYIFCLLCRVREIFFVEHLEFGALGIGNNDGIIHVDITSCGGFYRLFDAILTLLSLGREKASDRFALARADSYVIVDLDDGGVA